MTELKTRQVIVVDDHPIVRHGLKQVIEQEPDLVVSAEAESVPEALEVMAENPPDVAVVDLSLGADDGLELVKEIQARWSWLPVLVVSMHEEALYAERVLRAGALGYLNKQEATEKILPAIRAVLSGAIFVNDAIAARSASRRDGRHGATASPLDTLSDRELQVFRLIGQGLTTRQIAEQLTLSVKTIETYRAHLKQKLAIDHTTDLLRRAFLWVHSGEYTA
jgi:DNA-binding NarL/FixJ family response regulator